MPITDDHRCELIRITGCELIRIRLPIDSNDIWLLLKVRHAIVEAVCHAHINTMAMQIRRALAQGMLDLDPTA